MADNNPMDFIVGHGGTYEIYVLEQSLPALESPWQSIELKDKTFTFQRTKAVSKTFTISGYIQQSDMASTRAEAEGLNDDLNSTPSGTFTDGFGNQYRVLVDSWSISPVAGINKWNFTMSCRMVS